MKIVRKVLKGIVSLVTTVILLVLCGLGWLSLTEYQPAQTETVAPVAGARHDAAQLGKLYKVVTLNTGYGALGNTEDFMMDGGKRSLPRDKAEVQDNLSGLLSALSLQGGDLYLLQEVDTDSNRSYWINEAEHYTRGLSMGSAFAYNFRCGFVPFPWPPLGKVNSGVLTLSDLAVTSATREALPSPFSWPTRAANLKRCLLVERLPIQNSDRELVLINLHLEAYSSDEGRKAQMKVLGELLTREAALGNYVIAGGDFNQAFPGSLEKYPLPADPGWTPGQLSADDLPAGFAFAYDMTVPTCRSLKTPYDGDRSTLVAYVIDGFIVSPNVKVTSVTTFDLNFRNSDHQPVAMEFSLQ